MNKAKATPPGQETIYVDVPSEEAEKLKVEWEATDKETAAVQYKARRLYDYPTVADQLDVLYHKGFDAWKLMIKAVKDKHPKPE